MEGKFKTEETAGIWFDRRHLPLSGALIDTDSSGQPQPPFHNYDEGDRQESDPSNVTKFEAFDDSQPIKKEQVENFYLNSQHFPSSVGTSQHESLLDDSVTTVLDRIIKTECDEKPFTNNEENEQHRVNTNEENGVEMQEKDIDISSECQLQQSDDKQITCESITNIHTNRNGLDKHIHVHISNPQGNPVKITVLFEQELESGNKCKSEELEGLRLDKLGEKIKEESEEEHEFLLAVQERMETPEKNESSLTSLSEKERLNMLNIKCKKRRKKKRFFLSMKKKRGRERSKTEGDAAGKDKPCSCSLCGCLLQNKNACECHLKSVHSSGETYNMYKCSICWKLFEHKLLLNEHMKYHLNLKTKNQSYSCPYCDKVFQSKSGYNYHSKSHSKEKSKFFCTECGKVYKSWSGLKYHYIYSNTCNSNVKHQTSNMNMMKVLKKSQSSEHDGDVSKSFQEVNSVKLIDSYVCYTCGKHYSSLTGFKYHLQKHNSKEQKHHCPICGKEYASTMGLRYHSCSVWSD